MAHDEHFVCCPPKPPMMGCRSTSGTALTIGYLWQLRSTISRAFEYDHILNLWCLDMSLCDGFFQVVPADHRTSVGGDDVSGGKQAETSAMEEIAGILDHFPVSAQDFLHECCSSRCTMMMTPDPEVRRRVEISHMTWIRMEAVPMSPPSMHRFRGIMTY